jgi:predicted AlkP superfamily phosphohydrolase/phosphomutase
MIRPAGATIVIGLELGDAHLVHAWARAGRLPAIQEMMDRGCWGWLETTADQLHISAWPSIYTGASPGEHGVYFTFQPAPGLQGYRRFHAGLYGRPTFWHLLDGGRRACAVLDAPYSHPEPGYTGAFVHDWGSWAHYLAPGSVPADLLPRLEQACGHYPLGLEANDLGLAPLDPAETARRLVQSVKAKAKAARWLMRQRQYDLLFCVFGETHVAGHYCWSDELRDESARLQTSPMRSVYEELDRAIAAIRGEAGADVTVVVLSGDSVGPNHAGWHLLPDVLARLGYFTGAEQQTSRKFDPVKSVRDLLPKDFRKNLARMLPTALRDRLAQHVDAADIDWSRTRAYCLPTDLEGYVRVNLHGREPLGTVGPGAEHDQVLRDLMIGIGELRDPRSGRPIVRDVLRTDEIFPGERSSYLPDLIVRWEPGAPIAAAASERIGVVAKSSPDPRPGTHRGPGFVLAQGPGIPAGSVMGDGHILDFAPTLLTRMDVAVPDHMRGRVWLEMTAR